MTMILKNGKIFFAGLAGKFSQELVTQEGVSLTHSNMRKKKRRQRERGSGAETARIRGICTHNTSSV
jgi:hypothetical protein